VALLMSNYYLFSNDSGHLAEGDPGASDYGETESNLAKAIRDSVNVYCNALKIPDISPPYFYDTVQRLEYDPRVTHKISIHINSSGPKSTGLLALKNEQGSEFAKLLMSNMSKYTGLRIIDIKYYYDNWVNGQQRYTREFDVAKIPLVLIEAGFISNQNEIKLIKNSYLMAKGIVHSYINMYYNCYKITWFKIGSLTMVDNFKSINLKTAPIIRNSRTLIGLADVASIYNASIIWYASNKSMDIEVGSKVVHLIIGNQLGGIDGKYFKLNVIPQLISNRTYIGLSDLTTIFGGVIFFTPQTKEIILLRY
jgi:hypothetical protein